MKHIELNFQGPLSARMPTAVTATASSPPGKAGYVLRLLTAGLSQLQGDRKYCLYILFLANIAVALCP